MFCSSTKVIEHYGKLANLVINVSLMPVIITLNYMFVKIDVTMPLFLISVSKCE